MIKFHYYMLQQPSKVIGYQCSICLRKFLHLGTHCNHATNAHQIPGLQPVEVEMKPRYTCKQPRCGKHFMTKVMILIPFIRHYKKMVIKGNLKLNSLSIFVVFRICSKFIQIDIRVITEQKNPSIVQSAREYFLNSNRYINI